MARRIPASAMPMRKLENYLMVSVFWYVGTGVAFVAEANQLEHARAYHVVVDYASLHVWGWVLLVMAAVLLLALNIGNLVFIRILVVLGFTLKLTFGLAIVASGSFSPTMFAYLTLAAYDYAISRAIVVPDPK